MYTKHLSRLCLVLFLFMAFCSFPPLVTSQEMTDQQIIQQLKVNLNYSLTLNERLWGKYLISEENLRQEMSLSETLDQNLKQSLITISNLETSSSKRESMLTRASDFLENLKEDYDKMEKRERIKTLGLYGIGAVALVEFLIIIF